jgi:two-component system, OmpR family, sensor kinase
MSRLPIRIRLTLAFVVVMAAMLAGAGFLLYHHEAASLDHALDQGLRARGGDVAALVQQSDSGHREATPGGQPAIAQVMTARGAVVD